MGFREATVESRTLEGEAMDPAAPKRGNLPDVALIGAGPPIAAFVFGNAERA